MALYKGSQKVSGSGNSFNPQNTGTTGQVLSKTASGYEWEDAPATGIGSSNDTYEDIIYLSQSDYDALQNKDPNTLYSTPEGESGEPFEPSNAGTTGQVLTKTAGGYDWETPQTITVDSALSDSSENPVQNKVINSALQNLSVAPDHLEEMALVGEKYALTDTLFKQLTPKLADCTVDANVGDVAANTEIHIQRQGSKTASNKLKLKVKKVGSPTTSLYVEVRQGIQVDVSSSEAYWYGDSSNIIATGSLASSSFSSSYAEVEFTLDNNFGGTEGELLDVVVYQSTGSGATVNASNYYVLACDSTQWSEAFSYVKVNGTTRSREKLMPYCVSNGFVQAMLCKDKNFKYYIKGEKLAEFTYNGNNTQFSPSVYMNGVLIEMDLDFDAANPWIGASLSYSSGYAISGFAQASKSGLFYMKFTKDRTCYTLSLYKSATSGTFSNPISLLSNTIRIFKYIGEINGKQLEQVYVREVKNIGKKTTITTFGKHIDNTRILDENAFTNSDKIKYCKTKGTNHSNSQMLTSYTAIGFGYFVFSGVGNSNSAASVEINGDWVAYSSYSTAYISGIEFFKPGDVINFSGLTYLGLHDYY